MEARGAAAWVLVPITSAAAVCQNTSVVSGVPLSLRVMIIMPAKASEPAMAISAGQPKAAPPGFSAMMTPTKPMAMAIQR